MNRKFFILSLCLASATALFAYDAQKIDGFKAVFDKFPTHTPTALTVDAPVTGNGDIGLTMMPTASKLTFFVGKNDFWRAIPSYPLGGPMLCGGVDLVGKELQKGTYYAEQLPGTAQLKATFTTSDNSVSVTAWVAALDNKVVFELSARKQTTIGLRLWSPNAESSTNDSGHGNGCTWVTRAFQDLPHLEWPSCVAMAVNHDGEDITLQPGETKTLVMAVYTNHDTPEWKEKALSEASAASASSVEETRKRHLDWWSQFWGLSSVNIGDEFMEKYYYQSQYLFACASREGKFAPGLWGPFITQDNVAWAGDYHLNYNYQGPYWASFSSNHICLTENYDQPILDYMEKGREHARILHNCGGVLYPVGIGPKGLTSAAWPIDQAVMNQMYGNISNKTDNGAQFWQQRTNASFCAANMMMHFYSTYDRAYAERIYPFLKACAEFWEDYLTLEDGRYVIHGDVFNETAPWANYKGDFNCIMSLGMTRMTFLGVNNLSRFLGVDKAKRAKWNDILKRLSDYPVTMNDKGRLSLKYCDRKEEQKSNDEMPASGISRLHMHGILLPTCLTGPISTPELNKVMLDDLGDWKEQNGQDWGNSFSNGIETVYPGAVRIGFPARDVLKYLRNRIEMKLFPNCYIEAAGGGLETLAAVPLTINEMLMQSYEGVVRIFPNWDYTRDASFSQLRAYGAFLVSSSIRGGEIQKVTLFSEQGRPCVMQNPWPDRAVKLMRDGKVVKTLRGEMFRFKTKAGETLELQ